VNDLLIIRILAVAALTVAAALQEPFGLNAPVAAAAGAAGGAVLVFLETRLQKLSLRRLGGGALGLLGGCLAALLITLTLEKAFPLAGPTVRFAEVAILLAMAFLGVALGTKRGDPLMMPLTPEAVAAASDKPAAPAVNKKAYRILDTSVVIDGRVADIAETGFLDGVLVIPQFVLRELQLVADSPDSMKRNRGRRGLDLLQRVQNISDIKVLIVEEDFPHVRDVDMKLIELAKLYECKVVTNDFNLNKVAQLHKVAVLNINELANALKPVVLPGETMKVFILKEGKEYNQGVAYLDDGTMVVVDNARRMVSKTIEVAVTSVLQTTAGKMIFGRFDERIHTVDKAGGTHPDRHESKTPHTGTPHAGTPQSGTQHERRTGETHPMPDQPASAATAPPNA